MELNKEHCYQALLTHDPRFDGKFFVAVKTTRIYCRTVCKAKLARFENCNFFLTAAAAEQSGYRPCLRCRPELAPGNSPLDSVSRLAAQAVSKIEDGVLTDQSVEDLADKLGVSHRHLQRVMDRELGVSPIELAQTHRLLLAKRLLTDTKMSVTDIAFASGFSSIRRFNTMLKERYGMSPRDFRKKNSDNKNKESLIAEIAYRSPIAWKDLLLFLQQRACTGVEWTDGKIYRRTVRIKEYSGWLQAKLSNGKQVIIVEMSISLAPVMIEVIARLKKLFDLGAEPSLIANHLGILSKGNPGLRVPGAFDPFEVAIRAIIGQQISVKGASTLATRLVNKYGNKIETPFAELNYLWTTTKSIAEASVKDIADLGFPTQRAKTIKLLAKSLDNDPKLFSPNNLEETISKLRSIKGIGDWTAQYISMRTMCNPNAFPHTDLGILKAMKEKNPKKILGKAKKWEPWRAYAAMHLWKSLEEK